MHSIVRASISLFFAICLFAPANATEPEPFAALADEYARVTRPIMANFCNDCHSTADREGELDLERFTGLPEVRTAPNVWQKVAEMLDNGEMPPKSADQPSPDERRQLRAWVARCLNAIAQAGAGDPGPVVLRRLDNAQYTYSVRDLTQVELHPAREFPADGAAGEGFTNAGAALAMSPALLTKYLDAGKAIASHAVLLPDGFRFSPGTTRRDWSDELIAQIKQFYAQFADGEGRLPLERYFAAALDERGSLAAGKKTIDAVAAERRLNARYLRLLWTTLHDDTDAVPPPQTSLLLEMLRTRWKNAKSGDAAALANEVIAWQTALSRFQKVGHLKPWVVPVDRLTARQEIRFKVPESNDGNEVTLYLSVGSAGDGPQGDMVLWQSPRLVTPGRPDLLLRDVRGLARQLVAQRERLFASTAKYLAAAMEAGAAGEKPDRAQLAARHGVEPDALGAWFDYLGLGESAAAHLDHFKSKLKPSADYDFIQGWGSGETPLIVANSSDQHVRIPGNMKPHGVAVHPSPKLSAAVTWQSPIAGQVRISGQVTHAHPECGNGVSWSLEWRRGKMRQQLAAGTAQGRNAAQVQQTVPLPVRPGDLVSLVIGPRDGNHACDLTDIEFVIEAAGEGGRRWSLTADVSSDVLAGNPHADGFGNPQVWHFYAEPQNARKQMLSVPTGSVLARWQLASSADEKVQLADAVERLLVGDPPADKNHPDSVLYRQLTSLNGPLFATVRATANEAKRKQRGETPTPQVDANTPAAEQVAWGLDPALFGRSPEGVSVDDASLCMQAPAVLELRLPADLAAGCELVTTGVLQSSEGEGSVQLAVSTSPPAKLDVLRSDAPVLANEASAAWQRFRAGFDGFRRLFPAALCYSRLVPVDEGITLAQFHREDEPLVRLMLDDNERARLDRLWEELHFVSRDALTIVDSYAQLMEYATQDSDPRPFEHLREPIEQHADELRRQLLESEPRQLDALVDFAALAYRRPITSGEVATLRGLYRRLRQQELPHEQAFQLTLARLFVSSAFLYRLEEPPPGKEPAPVLSWELANRLSYFLWSSIGDAELREAAASGRLTRPDVLREQTHRMLRDGRVRRLAREFACQWLHIYDFDALDEKSERHFPSFNGLRGDMYEEAIRFFTDLFQRDGSVLEIWDCDYMFVNEALAAHYGIPDVSGNDWRRIDGARQYGRGGVLAFAATLAKQSGASRTSPILRGNWISEALLGERLPRPPKDTPQLPDDETATDGLTVRQLVEKHTSDERCAHCHVRIDPFGFALEGYDAIGGRREKDLSGRPIETHARLLDGAQFDGIDGLRAYLLTARRDAILRQFCRKLLGYALGRAVQLSDKPLLEEIERNLKAHDYRFSVAIETIVCSRQFREIRGRERVNE